MIMRINPLTYARDFIDNSTSKIWWIFEDDEGNEIAVSNPKMKPDVDDDGHHYEIAAWDKMRVNGEDATELQEDTYSDDLRDSIRNMDWE